MEKIAKIREQMNEIILDKFEEKQLGTKLIEKIDEKKIVEILLANDKVLDKISEGFQPVEKQIAYYRCAIMEIETKFKVLSEQFSLQYDRNPIETIKSRIKSNDSILRKLKRKGIPFSLEAMEENIQDIAGIRVICSFVDDVYLLADCLLQQDDITLLEKKDYIQNPKPSGYRSLHLIVEVPIFLENEKRHMKAEVQLRTLAMDLWASQEHKLRYKKSIPEESLADMESELAECAEIMASVDQRMQRLKDKMSTWD